jgi:hypothetical protein
MNKKLKNQILNFRNMVGFYLKNEYKPKYYTYFKDYPLSIRQIVESYYMGGNNVPDTARVIVEYVKKNLI